jgi:hypothetical protein
MDDEGEPVEQAQRVNVRAGTPESAAYFRSVLQELGETPNGLAKRMLRLGDDRGKQTILRNIQRMASGEARISGQMHVILNIFLHTKRREARDKAAREAARQPRRKAVPPADLASTAGRPENATHGCAIIEPACGSSAPAVGRKAADARIP